jgi:hypothetical protein
MLPKPDELEPLVDLMVRRGVRRLECEGLTLELDPAAQVIAAQAAHEKGEPVPDVEAQRAAGLCRHPGCDQKRGWMRTEWCKRHFQVALAGRSVS